MAGALEVIISDANVRSIFINIFGGITKGEEVANGIVQALDRVKIDAPIVIRLDGTNADEGRAILEPHLSDQLRMEPTMIDAARNAVELAGGNASEHLRRRDHQGRLPGPDRWTGQLLRPAEPRLRHAGRRAARTRRRRAPTSTASRCSRPWPTPSPPPAPNASCIFIPAPGVKGAVMEAAEAGIEFIVVHHRRRPRARRGVVLQQAAARLPDSAAPRARTAPGSSAPASATSASPPATSPRRAARSAS